MNLTLNSSFTLLRNETLVARYRAPICNALNSTILILALLIVYSLTSTTALADSESSWVHNNYHKGDFKLVYGTQAADILISPEDFQVVKLAANDLAADIGSVTGRKPLLRTEAVGLSEQVVMAGTLGASPLIDDLINKRKLDV